MTRTYITLEFLHGRSQEYIQHPMLQQQYQDLSMRTADVLFGACKPGVPFRSPRDLCLWLMFPSDGTAREKFGDDYVNANQQSLFTLLTPWAVPQFPLIYSEQRLLLDVTLAQWLDVEQAYWFPDLVLLGQQRLHEMGVVSYTLPGRGRPRQDQSEPSPTIFLIDPLNTLMDAVPLIVRTTDGDHTVATPLIENPPVPTVLLDVTGVSLRGVRAVWPKVVMIQKHIWGSRFVRDAHRPHSVITAQMNAVMLRAYEQAEDKQDWLKLTSQEIASSTASLLGPDEDTYEALIQRLARARKDPDPFAYPLN